MTLGVGTDLVDLDRFEAALVRTPSLVERLFTPGERERCEGRKRVERYAARFAAKEALLKALGCGLGACGWHDIEVVNAESGAPALRLTGRAAELATARGVDDLAVSLSHDGRTAIAVVVVTSVSSA